MRITGKIPTIQHKVHNGLTSNVKSVIYQSIRPKIATQHLVERSILHSGRATYYERNKNYHAALKNHLIALSFHKKAFGENLITSSIHLQIASCYTNLGNRGKAKQHTEIANDISRKFSEK